MNISLHCDRNLRRALLMLEATKVQNGSNILNIDQSIQLPDWELYICRLAREILQEQSPSKLLQAREMLYELLTNCIPSDVILSTLSRELMKSLDDTLKHEVSHFLLDFLIYILAYIIIFVFLIGIEYNCDLTQF
jgi:replication factor C subunit 3/5